MSAHGSACSRAIVVALLTVTFLAAAQPAHAHRYHGADARIGAKAYVLSKARSIESRRIPGGAESRVTTGDVGTCRRLGTHLYACPAVYVDKLYSLTAATRTNECTETVRVTVSHRFALKYRTRSATNLTCTPVRPPHDNREN